MSLTVSPRSGMWGRLPLAAGLRVVAVILVLLELVDLIGLAAGDPRRLALAGVATVSAVVMLWRPVTGTIVGLPAMVGSFVLGWGPAGQLPLAQATLLLAARAPIRAVLALYTVFAVLMLADWWERGSGDLTLRSVAVFVALGLVGFVVRGLTRQGRRGAARIATLEQRVAEVRVSERRSLSTELSRLVEGVLADNDDALRRARASDSLERSARALADMEASSRMALTHIRRLVATLRGEPTATFEADLVALAEEVEDQLVGQGLGVEMTLPQELTVGSPAAARAVESFLRDAAAHATQHGRPGSACTLTLSAAGGEITVQFSHEVADLADDVAFDPPGVAEAGGRVGVRVDDGRWWAEATLARKAPSDAAARVGLRDRWATLVRPGLGRLLSGLPGLAGVVHFGGRVLIDAQAGAPWHADALWATAWAAVGAAAATLPATALLTTAVVATSTAVGPLDPYFVTPVDLAVAALAGSVAARRPGRLAPVLLAWLAYQAAWLAVQPSTRPVSSMLVPPLLGGVLGLGAHFFVATRNAQQARMQQLRADALAGRDAERRHLAGELHDIVAHQLSLISMHLMAHHGVSDPQRLAETIDLVAGINESARADLNTLVHLLEQDGRGDAVDDQGGLGAPSQTARAVAGTLREAGHQVTLGIDEGIDDSDPTTQRTLSRILREATTNILRYAEPNTPCTIASHGDEQTIDITVTSQLPRRRRTSTDSTGWGLLGLEERAAMTNGTFTAGRHGDTWVVSATVPRFPTASPIAA